MRLIKTSNFNKISFAPMENLDGFYFPKKTGIMMSNRANGTSSINFNIGRVKFNLIIRPIGSGTHFSNVLGFWICCKGDTIFKKGINISDSEFVESLVLDNIYNHLENNSRIMFARVNENEVKFYPEKVNKLPEKVETLYRIELKRVS